MPPTGVVSIFDNTLPEDAAYRESTGEYVKGGVDDITTVYLRRWCQAGFSVCVTVNPELFHHCKKAGTKVK